MTLRRILLALLTACGLLAVPGTPAAATSGDDLCPAGPPSELVLDEPGQGSIAGGQSACFVVHVDDYPDELLVTLEGPHGEVGRAADLDLYVRWQEAPERYRFDCRSTTSRSDEACAIDSPKRGEWHIAVVATGSGGGFRLSALTGACVPVDLDEVEVGQIAGGELDCRRVAVGAGEDVLRVEMTATGNPESDVDLFVKFGSQPEFVFESDCYSFSLGNKEACLHPQPQAGTWFMIVSGFRGQASYELVASTDACEVLSPDGTSSAPRVATGRRADCFRIGVAGADLLRAGSDESAGANTQLTLFHGGTGICEEADESRPAERCAVSAPDDGHWYLVIRFLEKDPVGSYTASARTSQAEPITAPLVEVTTDGTGDLRLYRLDAGGRTASAVLAGHDDADLDLYVRRGAPPRLESPHAWDCVGESPRSAEACVVGAGTGDIFILVRSFYGAGRALLNASAPA